MRPDHETPWTRLSELVAERIGLHFPNERLADLQRGLAGAAAEFGFADVATCADWLLGAPLTRTQLQVLASHLTIGETYFFRDKKTFDVLASRVLPDLIHARRGREQRLRLWSAACCSGEEAYSLAILLHQLLPDLADWQVTILATDINARFLRKAVEGSYGEWSFRDAPSGFKERYFHPAGNGQYVIRPDIKKLVTFEHLEPRGGCVSVAGDRHQRDGRHLLPQRADVFHTRADQEGDRESLPRPDRWWVAGGQPQRGVAGALHAVRRAELSRRDPLSEERGETSPRRTTPRCGQRCRSSTESRPASFAQATSLHEHGRSVEAADPLLPRCAGHQPDPRAFSLVARALANQGRLTEALAWCDRWIAADKLDAAGHYLRAVVLLEHGHQEDARGSLQRVLYLEPTFVLAHFALGSLARSRDRHDEADRHFANTLDLLGRLLPHDVLPESDGLTAGRLTETITAMTELGNPR